MSHFAGIEQKVTERKGNSIQYSSNACGQLQTFLYLSGQQILEDIWNKLSYALTSKQIKFNVPSDT